MLEYTQGIEFVVFGPDIKFQIMKQSLEKIPKESENLDIVQGGTKDIGDPPLLEKEEDPAKRQQKGKGLKIMTPGQMITRLPILLAQLKAGNNSQKLKNEIRQIGYSLYRSKNLQKTIYNHLIAAI